jgi:hypothetical protein
MRSFRRPKSRRGSLSSMNSLESSISHCELSSVVGENDKVEPSPYKITSLIHRTFPMSIARGSMRGFHNNSFTLSEFAGSSSSIIDLAALDDSLQESDTSTPCNERSDVASRNTTCLIQRSFPKGVGRYSSTRSFEDVSFRLCDLVGSSDTPIDLDTLHEADEGNDEKENADERVLKKAPNSPKILRASSNKGSTFDSADLTLPDDIFEHENQLNESNQESFRGIQKEQMTTQQKSGEGLTNIDTRQESAESKIARYQRKFKFLRKVKS